MNRRWHPALLIALSGVAGACIHTRAEENRRAQERQRQGAIDDLRRDLEAARAKAMASPGNALEAQLFAKKVTDAHRNGSAAVIRLPASVDEDVVRCLDGARQAHPEEAYVLLANKGFLFVVTDKEADGVRALEESMQLRPNLIAFRVLGKVYGDKGRLPELEAVCKRALAVATDAEDRFLVLNDCMADSGASTVDGGLRWARAEDVTFYRRRFAEIEAEHAKFEAQQKVEEDRNEKEFKEKSEQNLRRFEDCRRQCESVGSLCHSGCGGSGSCDGRCREDSRRCVASCRGH